MATGGGSFTTVIRTLGGPARGAARSGRYASGAGYTVVIIRQGKPFQLLKLGNPEAVGRTQHDGLFYIHPARTRSGPSSSITMKTDLCLFPRW